MARKHRHDRGLYQRTRKDGTDVWGVRLSWHGRMLRFSPFASKTKAREFYEKAKTEQREGRFFPERYHHRGPLVQSFIERYLPTIHHKKTAKEEAVFAAWWGRWYAGQSIRSVTGETLEQARLALRQGRWSRYGRPRTLARVNRYTQWLHQMLAHPVNRGQLPLGRNPVDLIKKYPEKRPPRMTCTREQETALIARLEQETPGVTDWIRIAVACGLRQDEQFSRKKTDVDTHLWAFIIADAKHQDDPKIVYIPPSVVPSVRNLLKSPGPWLIPNPADHREPFPIKRWYKTKYRRAVKAIGLPNKFNWHSLRHTFASRMLMAGASTKTVAEAGGWSSERMVADVYGHLTNQFVVDAMERAATGTGTAPASGSPSQSNDNSA